MFVCRRLETTNLERLYSNWIVATAGTSIFICRANCFDCFSFTVWVANNNWYYQINWMYILNLTMIRVFHPQSWPSLKIGPSASQLLISNIRLIHFVCCCLSAEKKNKQKPVIYRYNCIWNFICCALFECVFCSCTPHDSFETNTDQFEFESEVWGGSGDVDKRSGIAHLYTANGAHRTMICSIRCNTIAGHSR